MSAFGPAQLTENYLRNSAPLLFLLVDPQGRVLDSNDYSSNLIGRKVQGLSINDIFLSFDTPLDITALRAGPEQVRMLSLTTGTGLPETLLCHFLPADENTLI